MPSPAHFIIRGNNPWILMANAFYQIISERNHPLIENSIIENILSHPWDSALEVMTFQLEKHHKIETNCMQVTPLYP